MSDGGPQREPRQGAPPPLTRMAIAVLALLGVYISAYMLLYALGAVGSVVCGVDGGCVVVQDSEWAVFLGVPVPAWGLAGYGGLLVLAIAGVRPPRVADRRIGVALLGLGTLAFLFSAYLTALEAFVIEAWCRWCVASAIVATLIFVLALTELPRLRDRALERR